MTTKKYNMILYHSAHPATWATSSCPPVWQSLAKMAWSSTQWRTAASTRWIRRQRWTVSAPFCSRASVKPGNRHLCANWHYSYSCRIKLIILCNYIIQDIIKICNNPVIIIWCRNGQAAVCQSFFIYLTRTISSISTDGLSIDSWL